MRLCISYFIVHFGKWSKVNDYQDFDMKSELRYVDLQWVGLIVVVDVLQFTRTSHLDLTKLLIKY